MASCLAEKYQIVLVITMIDSVNSTYFYNTAIAYDESGKILAKYHKSHLYGTESKYLDAGD